MTSWSSIVEDMIVLSDIKPPYLLWQMASSFSIVDDLHVFSMSFMTEAFWPSLAKDLHAIASIYCTRTQGFHFGQLEFLLIWYAICFPAHLVLPNLLVSPLVAEETENKKKTKCYSFHFHLAKRVQSNGINENENNLGSVGSKQLQKQQQGGEGGQGGGSEKNDTQAKRKKLHANKHYYAIIIKNKCKIKICIWLAGSVRWRDSQLVIPNE